MKWLDKLQESFRKRKLGTYKKRKVNIQKMTGPKNYKVTFDIIIHDNEAPPEPIGPFEIEIPARAMYFAKEKLRMHLKNNIDIHVHDFEIVVEEE